MNYYLLGIIVLVLYMLVNLVFIAKKHPWGEHLLQFSSFVGAAYFIIFGLYLYFFIDEFFWQGIGLFVGGFHLFITHLHSLKHQTAGW